MGRPKKNKDILDSIDAEMNTVIEPKEELKVGEVSVSKKPPATVQGSNEFGEDYTMEVIADNEPGADVFRIPYKDPKFEYRFLHEKKENMSVKTSNLLLMKGGWQVVPTRHLIEVNKIDRKVLAPDGSYHVGELVLAFMPKVLFEKKMAEDRRKSNVAMAGVKRLVEEGDHSKVNIKDVNGIQPGRMDGGRVIFDGRSRGSVKFGSHNEVDN